MNMHGNEQARPVQEIQYPNRSPVFTNIWTKYEMLTFQGGFVSSFFFNPFSF